MPLYEYRCSGCGKELEVIQKFSDAPLNECTNCGGTLERLLSAPAIQFKGSGWYITDYARGNGNDKSSSTKNDSSDKGETKTETSKSSTETTAAKSDTNK